MGPVWAGFGTVGDPSAADVLARATTAGRRIAVVPLFLAPGLLLDQIAQKARAVDAEVALPLGTALAELVVQRYLQALAVMPASSPRGRWRRPTGRCRYALKGGADAP